MTNVMLSKLGIKEKAGFKVTEKTHAAPVHTATASIQTALLTRMTSLTRRFNQSQVPHLYVQQPASTSKWRSLIS